MRLGIAPFLLSFLLLSCTGGEDAADRATSQVLRLNIYTEPPTLDPGRAADTTSAGVLLMAFDGLMRMGEGDVPHFALAESVIVSPDGKTYTFTLRPSTWSNGDPLTAHDFEYAWKRILDPNFPAEFAQQLYPIKGAKEVKEGKLPLEALGVHAQDDKTLVIELERPTPFFLELATLHTFLPVHRKSAEQNPNWAYEAGPDYVSNGPFLLKSWKHNNEIILVKNPRFWNSDAVKLSKISLSMIEDANTELQLFQNGALDWAGTPISIGLPTDAIPSLKASGNLQVRPAMVTYFYELNTLKPPLNNANFRKALAYAINRQSIIDNIKQGDDLPALEIAPPAMGLSKTPYFRDADVQEARRLFALALKELRLTRQQLPTLTLSYNTSETHHKIAQAIQQQWNEALGLQVVLENAEWKVYLDKIRQKNFSIARLSWKNSVNDPIDAFENLKSVDNPMNASSWHHPRFTQLLDEASNTLDQKKRKALLQQAEQILLNEMPMIPILHTVNRFLKNPRLQGLYFSPTGEVDFTTAYFAPLEEDSSLQ